MEALRLAVHHPEKIEGRLDIALFSSALAAAVYAELASAMTLHEAIESAAPEVADLLGQLAVEDTQEDADDVLGQLIAQAAARALAELRREARSSTPERSHSELRDALRACATPSKPCAPSTPARTTWRALGRRGASLASFVAGKS